MSKQQKAAADARTNELLDLLVDLMSRAELMPRDLYQKLHDDLMGQLGKQRLWTTKIKNITRWKMVCEELNRRGWDGKQYINASKALIGHPAHAGPAAMKAGYDWVQNNANPGWVRRPKRIG